MDAQCDTLVILDCFNRKFTPATLNPASILQDQEYAYKSEFRKHLIGACEPYRLSVSLKHGFGGPGFSIPVSRLVQHIKKEGFLPREKYPLTAFHLVLAQNDQSEMVLTRTVDYDADNPWDYTDMSDQSSSEMEE